MEYLFKWLIEKFILFYCFSAVSSLLIVFMGVTLGCRILISFQVGILMIFYSAPESIKKSISRSGG